MPSACSPQILAIAASHDFLANRCREVCEQALEMRHVLCILEVNNVLAHALTPFHQSMNAKTSVITKNAIDNISVIHVSGFIRKFSQSRGRQLEKPS